MARAHTQSRFDRKAHQLCRQVARTLELVLSGDSRDDVLQSLRVEEVVPAPDSTQLLVLVSSDLPAEHAGREQIVRRLNEQAGRLRTEVAASITRKRAPVLLFQVLATDT